MFELCGCNHGKKSFEIKNISSSTANLAGWTINTENGSWQTQMHLDDIHISPGDIERIDASASELFKSSEPDVYILIDPVGKCQSRIKVPKTMTHEVKRQRKQ